MVVQYPHTLTYTSKPTSDAYLDASGFWVYPSVTTSTVECRAEPNTSAKLVSTPSGDMVNYDFTIYIAEKDLSIPFDSMVTLSLPQRTVTTKVKRFEVGQINARIWI